MCSQSHAFSSTRLLLIRYVYGATIEPEISTSKPTPVHIYYTSVPKQVTVPAGQSSVITQTFLMSVSPLQQDAKTSYISGYAPVRIFTSF